MADEIRTSISFQVSKGGAAIATGTLSDVIDMTGADMATVTQLVSTAANDIEALGVPGDVTGNVYLVVKHLGGSGVLTISKDNGGPPASHVLSKLEAGEACFLTRVPASTLFVASTVAGTPIQFWISEV
jgi:hypothetical protein